MFDKLLGNKNQNRRETLRMGDWFRLSSSLRYECDLMEFFLLDRNFLESYDFQGGEIERKLIASNARRASIESQRNFHLKSKGSERIWFL